MDAKYSVSHYLSTLAEGEGQKYCTLYIYDIEVFYQTKKKFYLLKVNVNSLFPPFAAITT